MLFRSYNYDHEASGSRCIHLYFGLRKLASRSANAKIFRLPVTLQNPPEAVPPAGISTASLLSVTIAIEYTPANETIEYMPTHLYTTPMVEWDNSKKNHFLITPPSSQNQYLPPKSSQETCLDEDAGPYIKEDASEADEAWVPFHCFHASKHSSLCKEDFDKLLDISIRSLITPKPTCVDEIIQQEKDEYSTHLCSLAPTVFSMGYSGVCHIYIPSDSHIANNLQPGHEPMLPVYTVNRQESGVYYWKKQESRFTGENICAQVTSISNWWTTEGSYAQNSNQSLSLAHCPEAALQPKRIPRPEPLKFHNHEKRRASNRRYIRHRRC